MIRIEFSRLRRPIMRFCLVLLHCKTGNDAMKIYYLFTLMLIGTWLGAQNTAAEIAENIVPNPSFERYSSPPIGWFYKGPHFTKVLR